MHFTTRTNPNRRIRRIRNNYKVQKAAYNRHKRHHGIKFQSLVLPDGIGAQMFGPVEGHRHDATLLKLVKLDQKIQLLPPGSFVFGDQAYQVRLWLLSPFRVGENIFSTGSLLFVNGKIIQFIFQTATKHEYVSNINERCLHVGIKFSYECLNSDRVAWFELHGFSQVFHVPFYIRVIIIGA